jgi:hypothetical protein
MLGCRRHESWQRCLGWAADEKVGDLIVDGQKSLHLPRRFEAFHDPLSSSRWLMRILRPVIEAYALAMLDARHDVPLGSRVAAQLIGDQHTRRLALLLQQLALQALGCLLVTPALNQDIENETLLVDRAPEPVLFAGDGQHDFIEMPFVTAAGCTLADAVGEVPANFRPHWRIVS